MKVGRLGSKVQFLFAGVLIAVAVAGAGCGGGGDEQEGAKGPAGAEAFKIGIIAPLSGAGAVYGLPVQYAWEALVEEVNSKGGLQVGGQTYRIELTTVDSKWDPTITRSAAERLVGSGVKVISMAGAPEDAIVVPITEENKVIVLETSANKSLMHPPHRYVFNYYIGPNVLAVPYFKELRAMYPSIRTVAFIGVDAGFARTSVGFAEEAAKTVGLKSLGVSYFQSATVDFTTPLIGAVRKNPDLISMVDTVGNNGPILKALRSLGYEGPVAGGTMADPLEDTVESGGTFAEGFLQSEYISHPYTPALADFRERYEASSGGDWGVYAVPFWLMGKHLIEALQVAGTVSDPDKIAEALAETTILSEAVRGSPVVGMGGEETYGRDAELQSPVVVNQVVDGEIVTRKILEMRIP